MAPAAEGLFFRSAYLISFVGWTTILLFLQFVFSITGYLLVIWRSFHAFSFVDPAMSSWIASQLFISRNPGYETIPLL